MRLERCTIESFWDVLQATSWRGESAVTMTQLRRDYGFSEAQSYLILYWLEYRKGIYIEKAGQKRRIHLKRKPSIPEFIELRTEDVQLGRPV